jgi:hypothetical protein
MRFLTLAQFLAKVAPIAAGHRKLDNSRGHFPYKSADRCGSRIPPIS